MMHPPTTLRSTPVSPPLLGNFGASPITIVRVIAFDSGNDDAIYNAFDFITIQFSENTDKGRPQRDPYVSQYEIESMFEFSQNIGTTYDGQWLNSRTIQIIIRDATGSGPPVIDQLTVRVRPCMRYFQTIKTCYEDYDYCAYCDCCLGDLRNLPRTSAPTALASPKLSGDFGPCQIAIINMTAFDASNFDSTLDDGDAIMVYFTEPTDKGCGYSYLQDSCRDGKHLNKSEVDNLLTFSEVLGNNYSAVWLSSMQLRINFLDITESRAQIGKLTITITEKAKGDGKFPGMRNLPPVCGPNTIKSQPVLGNWGLTPPFIDSFFAVGASSPADSVYGQHDEIIIDVCAGGKGSRGEGGCEPTNRFNFDVRQILEKPTVLRMFAFSQDLGFNFVGQWDNDVRFRITVLNASGASPPTIHKLTVRVLHLGTCSCEDSLCTSYTCTPQGWFLRDASNRSMFSTSESQPIRGDWGISSISIVRYEKTGSIALLQMLLSMVAYVY
jgi:hypothetical protein